MLQLVALLDGDCMMIVWNTRNSRNSPVPLEDEANEILPTDYIHADMHVINELLELSI